MATQIGFIVVSIVLLSSFSALIKLFTHISGRRIKYRLPKLSILLSKRGPKHTHKKQPIPPYRRWRIGGETKDRIRRRRV